MVDRQRVAFARVGLKSGDARRRLSLASVPLLRVLPATQVEVWHPGPARGHFTTQLYERGQTDPSNLEHYLDVLARKPGRVGRSSRCSNGVRKDVGRVLTMSYGKVCNNDTEWQTARAR